MRFANCALVVINLAILALGAVFGGIIENQGFRLVIEIFELAFFGQKIQLNKLTEPKSPPHQIYYGSGLLGTFHHGKFD